MRGIGWRAMAVLLGVAAVTSPGAAAAPADRDAWGHHGCTVVGSAHRDVIASTAPHAVICAGPGNDSIEVRGAGTIVYGDQGDDTITFAGGSSRNPEATLYGGSGNDVIQGGSGIDWIHGGSGNDTISGSAGNDRIRGDSGNDVLNGGAGKDSVSGGSGNDIVTG